jgi:hypothetical protein
VLILSALKDAVTPPTVGVLTYATRVDEVEVSIFKPVVPPTVEVTPANALSVIPEQVTVTVPAARSDVTVNVIALLPVPSKAEVDDTEVGDEIAHKLTACASTRPAGKVRVILLLDGLATNGVDILNDIVAAWLVVAACDIVTVGKEMRLKHVATNGEDAELNC